MKAIKSTVGLALILYLCISLSGAPFVLNTSAKITSKPTDDITVVYEVQKGDSLWALAKKYRDDPHLWREFEKYNVFTNPSMIYPREQLRVSSTWGLPGTREAAEVVVEPPPPVLVDYLAKSDFDVFKDEFNLYKRDVTASVKGLGNQIDELHRQNQALQDNIAGLESMTESNVDAISELGMALKGNEAEIARLSKQVMGLQKSLDGNTAELQRGQERMDRLNTSVDGLAQEIGAIKSTQDKILVELEDFLQPAPPEPSKKTRTFAILTAVAGGVAWLAVSAIGGRD